MIGILTLLLKLMFNLNELSALKKINIDNQYDYKSHRDYIVLNRHI